MARLLLTGSTGYIGSALLKRALSGGHEVVELGSGFGWRIGFPIPPGVFDGVDAVIHLAHSWEVDHGITEEANANISGSVELAKAAAAAGVRNFVFSSSTSSRANALNVYGRTKFRIEDHLLHSDAASCVLIARIGLVYGGPKIAMYGLMLKLAGLTPILPMIGLSREVQPIHLEEVCEGLLTLALKVLPTRAPFVLANSNTITFLDWLRLLRKVQGKGDLRFLPVPTSLALLVCHVTAFIPFIPTIDPERVLGLAGASPMDSGPSLINLGLLIADPENRLFEEFNRVEGDVSVGEATVLLTYLVGTADNNAVETLAKALRSEGVSPLNLSSTVQKFPALLALYEPLATSKGHRLANALYLADLVREAEVGPLPVKKGMESALLLVLDFVLVPIKLILSRRYR